jgi:hypothetical protein
MSAYDPDYANSHNDFAMGESFGRHVREQELLPVLKAARQALGPPQWADASPQAALWHRLDRAIADIERPAAPVTTTPTDDKPVNF